MTSANRLHGFWKRSEALWGRAFSTWIVSFFFFFNFPTGFNAYFLWQPGVKSCMCVLFVPVKCVCVRACLCVYVLFNAYMRACACATGLINFRVFEQPKSLDFTHSSLRKLTFPECCCWKPLWESWTVYNPTPKKHREVEEITSYFLTKFCLSLKLWQMSTWVTTFYLMYETVTYKSFEWNVDIIKTVCYFYIVAQKQAGRGREGRKSCRIGAWINWIMMFVLFLTETSGCWLLQAFQKDEGRKNMPVSVPNSWKRVI